LEVDEDIADWFANLLRAKLSLPMCEPIVIPAGSDEEMLGNLEDHPVWRWHRFEVEKLPTAFLVEGFQIVAAMKERRASQKFARELLNRPFDAMPAQIRSLAFESLILAARNTNQFDTAIEWIEKAKKEVVSNNLPETVFLLHEVPVRLALGQIDKFNEVTNYLYTRYSRNEKVMLALQNIFIQLGILKPDGTPNDAIMQNMPQNAPLQTDGIWTPETVEKNSNSTKLWTPEG
ncbi:MAG: hypothetical protein LBK82_09880, partial [Planctomycetaceae bacterium]|jgi:hypothetical protein|nr:hypothetical protein [Planctomycetaceae bacterium]